MQQLIGKYRILNQLGRGSFATTYRAHDPGLDREVALKILHPQLLTDQTFVDQFMREARTVARLRHPNVVTIHEVASAEGRVFLAMELAESGSLADLIARRGRLAWAVAVGLLGPICAALDYIHGRGVLHRDLKPSNILLRDDGQPLIADFGLSRTAGQSVSAAGATRAVLGTPAYMAPEVWEGAPTSTATDIYALGCIIYEMVIGQKLFPDEALTRAALAHARGPQLPARWPEGVPAGLSAVLQKAMAQRPEARYQSAGALLQALKGCAAAVRTPATGERQATTNYGEWVEHKPRTINPSWRSERASRRSSRSWVLPANPQELQLWLQAGGWRYSAILVIAVIIAVVAMLQMRSAWIGGVSQPTPAPTIAPAITPTLEPTLLPALVPTLVKVPAGTFLMGSTDTDTLADGDEKPQHSLELPDYWIGKTEVTNAQFRPFVEGDGYTNQEYWTEAGWQWRTEAGITKPEYWDDPQWNGDTQPVVGVSWFEAVAYCRWLSVQTGHEFRLPSEAEWEKAARGTDGRIYPWGDAWDAAKLNSGQTVGKTTPVGQYPDGASPYGALDMAGNAWEWVATRHGKGYPYQIEDEWLDAYLESNDSPIVRGGCWYNDQNVVRGASRSGDFPRDRDIYQGMRVASHSPMPGSES